MLEPTFRTWAHCSHTHLSGEFSGSAYCSDKKFVVQWAATLSGKLSAIYGAVSMIAVPILGAYSDQHGRLPVLWICIIGHLFTLVIIPASQGSWPMLVCAFIIRGLTSVFFATFHAILADLGGNRSMAFTIKIASAQLGHCVGWAVALYVLHLEVLEYMHVWRACFCIFLVGGIAAMWIQESLPSTSKSETSCAGPSMQAVSFLLRDPFLIRWCIAKFFLVLGLSVVFIMRSFVIAVYDWKQGSFELFLGLSAIAGGSSTLAAPMLIRSWSAKTVVLRAAMLLSFAHTVLLLAPLNPMFCLGPLIAKSFGACAITASTTLIAETFTEDQGKAQSIVFAVATAGSSLGHLMFTSLFEAKAIGFAQARPFIVAAAFSWLGYVCLHGAVGAPLSSRLQEFRALHAPCGAEQEAEDGSFRIHETRGLELTSK